MDQLGIAFTDQTLKKAGETPAVRVATTRLFLELEANKSLFSPSILKLFDHVRATTRTAGVSPPLPSISQAKDCNLKRRQPSRRSFSEGASRRLLATNPYTIRNALGALESRIPKTQ